MKNRAVLCTILIVSLLFSACALPGCGAKSRKKDNDLPPDADFPLESNIPDDKVRNWYEIFVWSFSDSDGDGIGDLKGLESKLDYVAELGFSGIWLMPVMPSPSYHKYDVTDYYAIDPQYGTMEDMRQMLASAHEKGIRVIIDLPVNHSSDQHPWFISASSSADSPYRDWYVWSDTASNGFTERNGSWYESRFVSSMPDLNLDNPAVRDEIRNIMGYWLEDVGVDGFRLDAVTSYYTGQLERNLEFLTWLGDTAHAIAPECFLVGEAWTDSASISKYCTSSVDSFFTFPVSQAEGYIAKTLNSRKPGRAYADYTLMLEEDLPAGTIPAPFTENHDTGRTVGFTGRDNPVRTKMAGGLLCMMRGGIFVYYGQEIGMAGSGDDPNKRIGMLWTTEEETTVPPPGTNRIEYPYPSVEEQTKDTDSILNYYRHALAIRNSFPQIARGTSGILPCASDTACLIERKYDGCGVLIAVNPSGNAADIPLEGDAAVYGKLAATLCAGENGVFLKDGVLHLPAFAIAILTEG